MRSGRWKKSKKSINVEGGFIFVGGGIFQNRYAWLRGVRAWVSTGAKGALHPLNFWTVMSGTRSFWQFYYIMLCCTIEFWGFTSDWHPLFQIPNSSPGSGGWKKSKKSINVEGVFFCGRWNFSKSIRVTSRLLERWEYTIYVLKTLYQTAIPIQKWRGLHVHTFVYCPN